MIPIMSTELTLPKDPRLLVRDHATFLREAFGEAARFHHERHIPWHFESFAAAKYGYKKRSRRYQKRKDARGLPDLVWTGATRAVVKGSRQITKTQKGAKLILRLPFKGGTGNFRVMDGHLSDPQKQVMERIAEIKAIASDEARAISEKVREDYTRRANEPGVKYRVRYGKI
jgi:hypothetical protein